MKGLEKTIGATILTVVFVCICRAVAEFLGFDYVRSMIVFLAFQIFKHEWDHPKGGGEQ